MIELSDKEQVMYELVLKVLDGELTHEQAAAKAMVSKRTIYRKVNDYLRGGMGALAHKSRGDTVNSFAHFGSAVGMITRPAAIRPDTSSTPTRCRRRTSSERSPA